MLGCKSSLLRVLCVWHICSSSLVDHRISHVCIMLSFCSSFCVWCMKDDVLFYFQHRGSLTHMMHALWTQVGSSVVSSFLCVLHMTMNFLGSCIVYPICKWCVTLPKISSDHHAHHFWWMDVVWIVQPVYSSFHSYYFVLCSVHQTDFAHFSVPVLFRVYHVWERESWREMCEWA